MSFRFTVLLALILITSGCVTLEEQSLYPKDLLTKDEALNRLKDRDYDKWAMNPYTVPESICGSEKIPVSMQQIYSARYFPEFLTLTVYGPSKSICNTNYTFRVNDLNDANSLVKALNSLGARINYMFINN